MLRPSSFLLYNFHVHLHSEASLRLFKEGMRKGTIREKRRRERDESRPFPRTVHPSIFIRTVAIARLRLRTSPFLSFDRRHPTVKGEVRRKKEDNHSFACSIARYVERIFVYSTPRIYWFCWSCVPLNTFCRIFREYCLIFHTFAVAYSNSIFNAMISSNAHKNETGGKLLKHWIFLNLLVYRDYFRNRTTTADNPSRISRMLRKEGRWILWSVRHGQI